VVQLLRRHRLLLLRQDVDRLPRGPLRLHPGLHRQAQGRVPTSPGRSRRSRRARPHRRGVLRVAGDRRGPGGVPGKLGLARTVFPYVENHNFYIEHWSMSVFWRKSRELGAMLAKEGFFERRGRRLLRAPIDEVDTLLWDVCTSPGRSGLLPAGPHLLAGRSSPAARRDLRRLSSSSTPRRRWAAPKVVTEPFTIMLWGITSDSVAAVARRRRRRGRRPHRHGRVTRHRRGRRGWCSTPTTSVTSVRARSWSPRSPLRRGLRSSTRSAATVTDIGGLMSPRRHRLSRVRVPAVTGTGYGTRDIKTGDRIRVDGSSGKVTVLER
jgi:pyruvate, water dikinase